MAGSSTHGQVNLRRFAKLGEDVRSQPIDIDPVLSVIAAVIDASRRHGGEKVLRVVGSIEEVAGPDVQSPVAYGEAALPADLGPRRSLIRTAEDPLGGGCQHHLVVRIYGDRLHVPGAEILIQASPRSARVR